MSNTFPKDKGKIFYGYWVLLAVTVGIFIYAGFGLYSFSFFVKPINAELGWDRSIITLGFTIWSLSMGLVSPCIGGLVDRFGGRSVIGVGAIVTGLGFTVLSWTNNTVTFWLSYAVVGIGMAACAQVPASAVVSHWFVKRRGLAIGIMSVAVGIGGLISAPVVGGFLIPHFGWRQAYLDMAIFTWMVILPLSLFVIRTRPAEKGLYPDGANSIDESSKLLRATEGFSVLEAIATLAFWLIALCFLLSQFAQNGVMQTHVLYLSDQGFSTVVTSSFMGVVGMMSAVGKFSFGWMCDKIKPKYALAIGLILQLIGVIILLNIKPDSPLPIIWVYSVIWGFGIGSWLPVMSIMISSHFGMVRYGTIFGVMSFINGLGSAFGPLLSNYIFDATGGYQPALITFLVLFAISIPMVLSVRRLARKS